MNKWSIDQIPSQLGKVAIVTGANNGIGYEVTLIHTMDSSVNSTNNIPAGISEFTHSIQNVIRFCIGLVLLCDFIVPHIK